MSLAICTRWESEKYSQAHLAKCAKQLNIGASLDYLWQVHIVRAEERVNYLN